MASDFSLDSSRDSTVEDSPILLLGVRPLAARAGVRRRRLGDFPAGDFDVKRALRLPLAGEMEERAVRFDGVRERAETRRLAARGDLASSFS